MFGTKFVLERNKAGEFYFILRAQNGETIAVSESYKTRQGALNGIRSVRFNAPLAKFEDRSLI